MIGTAIAALDCGYFLELRFASNPDAAAPGCGAFARRGPMKLPAVGDRGGVGQRDIIEREGNAVLMPAGKYRHL